MAINMTQFYLTNIFGQAMNADISKMSVRLVSTSNPAAGYLQAGDFVSFHPTEAANIPVVQQAVSGALIDGIILFNAKKNQYNALDVCEIAQNAAVVTVQSGASFNRGAKLNYVPGTTAGALGSVFSTSSNIFAAQALDISTGAGQVVRVLVNAVV